MQDMLLVPRELLVGVGTSPPPNTTDTHWDLVSRTPFTDLKVVVDFVVCAAFYLLLGCSGDFEAPHMWDEKWKL